MTPAERDQLIVGLPPRLEPLSAEQCGPKEREMLSAVRKSIGLADEGPLPELVATCIRHAELWSVHTAVSAKLYSGALTSRDSELTILRVAWLLQSPYLWGQHVSHGKRIANITAAELDRITVGSTAPEWNEHERAILKATEELNVDAMISDATWTILARTLDEKQLIELPILVGQYHSVAFMQNSLRLRLMPGKGGLSAR